MVSLEALTQFLDPFFEIHRYSADPGGIYRDSVQPVQRLGLALEPWPGLGLWAQAEQLDALFLHRPWQLNLTQLAPKIGVISYHLAFDEHLTLGFNPRLATALGLQDLEILGYKEGRPLGMIGSVATQSFEHHRQQLAEIFGGQEVAQAGNRPEINRVAVVGAMTDALVREAADRAGNVYVTGQIRQPAKAAIAETGIGAIAVGHRRSEEWGLRALAEVLQERWHSLSVVIYPPKRPISN